jgi:hypothetical protein
MKRISKPRLLIEIYTFLEIISTLDFRKELLLDPTLAGGSRHSIASNNVGAVYPGMKEEIMNECGLKDRVPNFWSGGKNKFDGRES